MWCLGGNVWGFRAEVRRTVTWGWSLLRDDNGRWHIPPLDCALYHLHNCTWQSHLCTCELPWSLLGLCGHGNRRDFAESCQSGGKTSLEIHIEGLIWTKSRRSRESSGPVFVHNPLMRCISNSGEVPELLLFSSPSWARGVLRGQEIPVGRPFSQKLCLITHPTAYPCTYLFLMDGWIPLRTRCPSLGGHHPLRFTGQTRLNKSCHSRVPTLPRSEKCVWSEVRLQPPCLWALTVVHLICGPGGRV